MKIMKKSHFTKHEVAVLKVRTEEFAHYSPITKVRLSSPILIVHYDFCYSLYSISSAKSFVKTNPEHFMNVLYSEVRQMY